jgi:hypothetical protein
MNLRRLLLKTVSRDGREINPPGAAAENDE